MNDQLLTPTFFCPRSWEGMAGDETMRFCTYCQKHVHNVEALSVQERLALLTSPAGSICARYRVAIRRPAPGKKEAYTRHLIKYGASVAAAGTVLLTLWEMSGRDGRGPFYRVFGDCTPRCLMPDELYEENKGVLVGEIAMPPEAEMPDELYEAESGPVVGTFVTSSIRPIQPPSWNSHIAPRPFVDLKFDPAQLRQLEGTFTPEKPTPKSFLTPRKP